MFICIIQLLLYVLEFNLLHCPPNCWIFHVPTATSFWCLHLLTVVCVLGLGHLSGRHLRIHTHCEQSNKICNIYHINKRNHSLIWIKQSSISEQQCITRLRIFMVWLSIWFSSIGGDAIWLVCGAYTTIGHRHISAIVKGDGMDDSLCWWRCIVIKIYCIHINSSRR